MRCERKETGMAGGVRIDADRIDYCDLRRDGCGLYVLGVDALKRDDRSEARAADYIRRVREKRTLRATWVVLTIEIILFVCALAMLFGGGVPGR